jgi:hypothetical protein
MKMIRQFSAEDQTKLRSGTARAAREQAKLPFLREFSGKEEISFQARMEPGATTGIAAEK